MKQHITKECVICKEIKDINEFYKNKANKSGYEGKCKFCKLEYSKQYKQTDEYKKRNRKYQRQWAEEFRLKNPERNYSYIKKWVKNNREKVNLMAKNWRDNNPDKIAQIKSNRYAKEKGAEGSNTLAEWMSVLIGEAYSCIKCGIKGKMTKDHIIPLSKGGTDYIWNIQPMCQSCNSSKGATI